MFLEGRKIAMQQPRQMRLCEVEHIEQASSVRVRQVLRISTTFGATAGALEKANDLKQFLMSAVTRLPVEDVNCWACDYV